MRTKARKNLQVRPRKGPQTKGNACGLHEVRQQETRKIDRI